ncbi:MAG: hypothetical protein H7840_16680 [Alphaproteobacteria bacterium]
MDSVGAPPLPVLSQTQATALQILAAVTDPSPELRALAQGAQFDVKLLGDTIKALASVDSQFGQFSLRLPVGLAEGTTLTLQVAQTGSSLMQVRVLALNGQSVDQLAANPGRGGAQPQGPAVDGKAWGGAVDLFTLGQPAATGGVATPAAGVQGGISALVVGGTPGQGVQTPGPDGAALTANGPPQLATGTHLVVRIAALQAPTAPTGEPGTQAQPQTQPESASPQPQPQSPARPAAAAGGFAAYAATMGMGGRPQAPPSSPAAPAPPPATTPPLSAPLPEGAESPLTLTGTVGPNTVGGQPIIHTRAGLIALNARIDLPPGATVTLEVVSQTAPPPPTPASTATAGLRPGAETPLPTGGAGQPWPAFNEALTILQRTDPVAAQQFASLIPALGPRLAATMMGLAGVGRNGDTRGWPGEAGLKSLEKTGARGAALARELAEELTGGGPRRAGQGAQGNSGDWRVMTMPFLANGQVDRITFSVHQPPPEEEEERKARGGGERGTRFLIDLDLSRIGRLQLDGLVRKGERRFDMILRTAEPLPQQIRRDISTLFAGTGAAMDMGGNLVFQVAKTFVTPDTTPKNRRPSLFGVVV